MVGGTLQSSTVGVFVLYFEVVVGRTTSSYRASDSPMVLGKGKGKGKSTGGQFLFWCPRRSAMDHSDQKNSESTYIYIITVCACTRSRS